MSGLHALLVIALVPVAAWAGDGSGYVSIPGGDLATVLEYQDQAGPARLAPFRMMERPVTNAEFLAFVDAHPNWRRDRIADVFARPGYLAHWPDAVGVAPDQREQPVTRVSWFAASAYCAASGARLPRWFEWEYVAAADPKRRDARRDRAWREEVLRGATRPWGSASPRGGTRAANVYGVRDLHGGVWEWVDDYSALLVDADNRNQGDAERNRFCGAGALAVADREQYAVLMRIAMLASLDAADTPMNMGFRCVREVR